jgi:hypothetical protein
MGSPRIKLAPEELPFLCSPTPLVEMACSIGRWGVAGDLLECLGKGAEIMVSDAPSELLEKLLYRNAQSLVDPNVPSSVPRRLM